MMRFSHKTERTKERKIDRDHEHSGSRTALKKNCILKTYKQNEMEWVKHIDDDDPGRKKKSPCWTKDTNLQFYIAPQENVRIERCKKSEQIYTLSARGRVSNAVEFSFVGRSFHLLFVFLLATKTRRDKSIFALDISRPSSILQSSCWHLHRKIGICSVRSIEPNRIHWIIFASFLIAHMIGECVWICLCLCFCTWCCFCFFLHPVGVSLTLDFFLFSHHIKFCLDFLSPHFVGDLSIIFFYLFFWLLLQIILLFSIFFLGLLLMPRFNEAQNKWNKQQQQYNTHHIIWLTSFIRIWITFLRYTWERFAGNRVVVRARCIHFNGGWFTILIRCFYMAQIQHDKGDDNGTAATINFQDEIKKKTTMKTNDLNIWANMF